jgi:hypothetical protein
MTKIAEILQNALTLGAAGKVRELSSQLEKQSQEKTQLEAELKSLRDLAFAGDSYPTGVGAVGVVRANFGPTSRLFKKQHVRMLRSYAEYSVWVRAAINIYRDTVARAEWKLSAFDKTRTMNAAVERKIRELLDEPNEARKPYSQLQEELVEDYLVVGHGAMEIGLRNDATPYSLTSLDAARLAFYRGWDGSDPRMPRYALLDEGYMRPTRYLADPMAMVIVNCPRSYDPLGLSHVELLDLTVRALLEADDFFLREAQNPTKAGALNLGTGVTQPQVDEVRAEMNAVRHALIVMGGTDNAKFIPFNASERELKLLDRCVWFVRQVAAIFQVSTAALRLAVDTSRANTEAMFDNDQEGPAALLWRIREAENASIVRKFGKRAEHNIVLDYPIMSRKDEKRQAEISKIQTGGVPWTSINEARQSAGLEARDEEAASDILIPTPKGPVPLSAIEAHFFTGTTDGDTDGGEADETGGQDDQEQGGKLLYPPRRKALISASTSLGAKS